MPNPIKYTTGLGSLALKKGNFLFGTGDVGKGPSDTTGYYQGVDVPKPGYVVYQYREGAPGSLTYASFTGDTEFINFTNGLAGQTFTSTTQCLVYYRGQSDKVCFNRDYEPIITDGLILNTDAGFDGSYPESGTTWTDLSLSGNNGTLINSPGYYANGGGGIIFDGVDDYFFKDVGFYSTFTISAWVYPISGQSFLQYGRHPQNYTPILFIDASTTTLTIYTNNYYQYFSNSIILNSWNLITVVASTDTGLREVFVNGVSKGSNTFSILGVTNGELTVGRGFANQYANCRVSSVLFYNRALSSSEVLQNYNALKDRFAFIFTVDTTKTGVSTSTQFKLPLVSSGSINFVVEWGDGTSDTITTFNQAETTHTYSSGGVYEIKIRGVLKGWQFANGGDKLKMGIIKNWGCLDISVSSGFYGCTNMTCVATDAPTISSTSLFQYFQDCTKFNGPIGNWDVSNVTDMRDLFWGSSFNQNIGNWNVSKVTNFLRTFLSSPFNNGGSPDINNWRFSTSTGTSVSMSNTFGQSSFNQPINSWNTERITNMGAMFQGSSFNQNIGSWNVSNVTDFSSMFWRMNFNNGGSSDIKNWRFSTTSNISFNSMFLTNGAFNQPIGDWNTQNVTDMSSMFYSTAFNQNIGSWNVSKVTNFANMFRGSGFNNGGSPSISGWTMSAATTFNNMFRSAGSFNQPIGSWDTRNLTDISLVFEGANSFNQNIGTWDMSKVTNVGRSLRSGSFNNGGSPDINNWNLSGVNSLFGMFWDASFFDQPIKDWNITGVTTAGNFFTSGSRYSTANYDDILNTWSQKNVRTGVTINFASIKYSSAGAAGRATLVNTYGWTITDGGQI